jgi:hypothetical protein
MFAEHGKSQYRRAQGGFRVRRCNAADAHQHRIFLHDDEERRLLRSNRLPAAGRAVSPSRLLAIVFAVAVRVVAADTGSRNGVDLYVAEQITYDDNLFRLPVTFGRQAVSAGTIKSRQDFLNTATLGLEGQWNLAQQSVNVDARFSRNEFARNGFLNSTAANAKGAWNWTFGKRLSGDLGADYDKSLVGFANNRIFVKDVVVTKDAFADGRVAVGPSWALTAGTRHGDSAQSATAGQVNNYKSDTGTFGARFESPSGNTLDWSYAHTNARYPIQAFLNGQPFDRNYHDDTESFRVKYSATSQTTFEGLAGYVTRSYPRGSVSGFSGDTWRASILWQPDIQAQVTLAGWRQLTAYLDSQSNYFVGQGASITPVWSPAQEWKVTLACTWENQDYLGSNIVPAILAGRHDIVRSVQTDVAYSPNPRLSLQLTQRWELRGSNQSVWQYNDELAGFNVNFKL